MSRFLASAVLLACSTSALATPINTTHAGVIATFQSGATVLNFDSVAGRTPQAITAYTAGDPVSTTALIYDQFAGVRFSVGGTPGTDKPALYKRGGGIAGDAASGDTVLGPVDFDGTTKFNANALLEIFFRTKVSKAGFWLNPALGGALLIATDTNFAFSGLTETILETVTVGASGFVGFTRASADIGGFKVLATGNNGFTVDDFTFAAAGTPPTPTVPEPASLALVAAALVPMSRCRRTR